MRSYRWFGFALLALASCRSVVGLDGLSFDVEPVGAAGAAGDASGGGAGSAGVAGSANAGAAGSVAAGAAGASGGATCDVGPAPNACAKCERDNCCALVSTCLGDPTCIDCVSDPRLPACWKNANAKALLTCANKLCHVPCVTGGTDCNPITNEGCGAGDACDVNMSNTFACFPPDNVEPVCAKCDPAGPYCAPGLACLEGQCMVYCCDDADCGAGGLCDKASIGVGQLGVCVTKSGATKCDAPLPVASNGACLPK